jgi:hypothetical protein
MNGINLGTVPFQEAIDFFKQKVNLPTKTWTDIYGGQHARAFVVAGAMQSDMLGDFRSAVDKAISQGTAMEEFRKDFDKIVADTGWDYKGGRNWRTAVIYSTNLRSAYHAGRFAQQMDPDVLKEFPNLRYVHGASLVPRPEHLAWNGVTLPATDPWWETHYGQNGWGCKCRVESAPASSAKKEPEDFGKKEWTNPSTGEVRDIPVGIDPGFDHNPGEAAWGKPLAEGARSDDTHTVLTKENWESEGLPQHLPVSKTETRPDYGITPANALVRLSAIMGGTEKIFSITGNEGFRHDLVVDAEILTRHLDEGRLPFLPFLPEILEAPAESWLAFDRNDRTGAVSLRVNLLKSLAWDGGKKPFVFGFTASKGSLRSWTVIPLDKGSEQVAKRRTGKFIMGIKK